MFVGTRKLRSSGAECSIKLSEEGTERCGAEFACLQGRGSCGAAKRQRKKGNPVKSAAFRAGKKPKRQRNQRKLLKSAAFSS